MKKIMMVSIIFFLVSFYNHQVQAESYSTFEEITFEHKGAKLLEHYSNSDYDKYYEKLGKRRFWGWRTYVVYEDEEVSFIAETLYKISNDGTTAIDETIKFTKQISVKKDYSVTGNLGISGAGSNKKLKLGLEQEIGTNQGLEVTEKVEEVYTIKIQVDPQTKLRISIQGEGKITNGVGKYYRFFKNVKKGGFEIFVITSEYYSIEKEQLYEN